MNDPAPDPTTTHRLFAHERVAAGYALARPWLHPEVFARVRDLVRAEWPVGRALDVGCGTGLSSLASLDLARQVVGVDVAVPMLRRARRGEGLRYLASSAEELPFRNSSFDLIVACGSIDWVDRARFLPRAAEILVRGGWLVPLDFGDAGRSPERPDLERWYEEVFQNRFPRPPSPDPMVRCEEVRHLGFSEPQTHTFESASSFTASSYADFLMTESSVIAAVEYGTSAAAQVREWLHDELVPFFGGASRTVAFGGYIQALQKR